MNSAAGINAVDSQRSGQKALLISPRFPPDSFWSYRYILDMVGCKATFPPLGLLTFAAEMPEDWDFKVLDLNVEIPGFDALRREIAEADVVFAGAMSIQKRSLVELLSGPARGLKTPWVLGGPFPSTYRDEILNPRTESDRILFEGLDLLVWGEGGQWIEEIVGHLERHPTHSEGRPAILIPEAVLNNPPGSRKYLNDRTIFKPLQEAPPPRWDLICAEDYRSLMIQTTLGCPFRCDFCDIIDFNGGFTRVKTVDGVRRELEALLATGHRGGVFTVDDNFIGNAKEIESLLEVMIEFQRRHDYPFNFYTQASVNLGTPKLEHLIKKMKYAGFSAVFLGIENPDPAALNVMNKKQNKMVDIHETVLKVQQSGIEVFAGFIFGNDTDTPSTADEIVRFVRETGIFSAMTGMLTPTPHTPLYERLRRSGRLLPAEFSGNNTDDDVQFLPERMSRDEMREGIHNILESLFSYAEVYRRAGDMLSRIRHHIFTSGEHAPGDRTAALRSIWQQGVRRLQKDYFRLLWKAVRMDREARREAASEKAAVEALAATARSSGPNPATLDVEDSLLWLVDYARDYLVRFKPELSLQQVYDSTREARERLDLGRLSGQDLEYLCEAARRFLEARISLHRFPGPCLVHAFELAIQGRHYERVMNTIISRRALVV